jgi:hypothetical protein
MADTPVTFGLQLPCFSFPSRKGENVWAVGREIAQTAEGLGFESVWLMGTKECSKLPVHIGLIAGTGMSEHLPYCDFDDLPYGFREPLHLRFDVLP